jgi:hypothetical protein
MRIISETELFAAHYLLFKYRLLIMPSQVETEISFYTKRSFQKAQECPRTYIRHLPASLTLGRLLYTVP